MSKPTKKQPIAPAVRTPKVAQQLRADVKTKNINPGSKQSRIIALLRSPTGTTIGAMTKVTGWQQHSVRGFLAGVVRKRLKLKLDSKKIDGARVYRIIGGGSGKLGSGQTARRSR